MKTIFTYQFFLRSFYAVALLLMTNFATSQSLYIVELSDYSFSPNTLTINAGDTVEWRNTQGWHNVNGTTLTFPDNPESFGNSQGSNWTYTYVFNTAGSYNYQCDPHAGLGMNGTISVLPANTAENMLALNFSSMNPHVGQTLYLRITEQSVMHEVFRTSTTVEANFTINANILEVGKSYVADFFADHNGNGMYDAPPTDHAWRVEVNEVEGNTTLDFSHNTNFTDIMWKSLLTVNFNSMNPHIGQTLHFYVIEEGSGTEVFSTETTVAADFSITSPVLEIGKSYNVDFYSDHNSNGTYDAPPTDHAWRIEVDAVMDETVLEFTHNTNFTDIFSVTAVDLRKTSLLKVYPNPATNFVNVEFSGVQEDAQVTLFDSMGKKQNINTLQKTQNRLILNVNMLPQGIYLVELQNGTTREINKLIKY